MGCIYACIYIHVCIVHIKIIYIHVYICVCVNKEAMNLREREGVHGRGWSGEGKKEIM